MRVPVRLRTPLIAPDSIKLADLQKCITINILSADHNKIDSILIRFIKPPNGNKDI